MTEAPTCQLKFKRVAVFFVFLLLPFGWNHLEYCTVHAGSFWRGFTVVSQKYVLVTAGPEVHLAVLLPLTILLSHACRLTRKNPPPLALAFSPNTDSVCFFLMIHCIIYSKSSEFKSLIPWENKKSHSSRMHYKTNLKTEPLQYYKHVNTSKIGMKPRSDCPPRMKKYCK